MQVDDGAKAAPETILNAGEDWLTIIEGSQKEIPQDHWGIGATIKVRLDGDNLIISADEPGYSESTSVQIPALTTRPEPAADAVDVDRLGSILRMEYARGYQDAKKEGQVRTFSSTSVNDAALQAAAVEPEPGLDELLDSVHPEATVSLHYVSMPMADDPDPYWRAQVRVPLAGFVGNHMYEGTGATRTAAIAAAVRQAKENGDG